MTPTLEQLIEREAKGLTEVLDGCIVATGSLCDHGIRAWPRLSIGNPTPTLLHPSAPVPVHLSPELRREVLAA